MTVVTRTILGLAAGWLVARLLPAPARRHGVRSTEARRVTRRTFVRNATLGAVGVVLFELGAGVVRLLWPNKTGAFGSRPSVAAADIPPVDGPPFRYTPGKFYLVHPEDGLLALYWKCPHLGCTVPWNDGEQKFHCPCHGSIFLYNGVRIAGPAPRPMDLMRVTVLPTGDVEVDTGTITTRTGYEAQQAVPYPAA